MHRSLEARPFLPNSTSSRRNHRFSTYSTTALSSSISEDTSSSITSSIESRLAEIESGLRRLEDVRLSRQRFVPSEKKVEIISKLALAAKLDRALSRRMSGQDAIMSRERSSSSAVAIQVAKLQ